MSQQQGLVNKFRRVVIIRLHASGRIAIYIDDGEEDIRKRAQEEGGTWDCLGHFLINWGRYSSASSVELLLNAISGLDSSGLFEGWLLVLLGDLANWMVDLKVGMDDE